MALKSSSIRYSDNSKRACEACQFEVVIRKILGVAIENRGKKKESYRNWQMGDENALRRISLGLGTYLSLPTFHGPIAEFRPTIACRNFREIFFTIAGTCKMYTLT